MSITEHSTIIVPAGTTVYQSYGTPSITTKQAIVNVYKIDNDFWNWKQFLTEEEKNNFEDECNIIRNSRPDYRYISREEYNIAVSNLQTNLEAIEQKYKDIIATRHDHKLQIVYWSNGNKFTLLKDVVETTPKKAVEKKITIQQQMIKGATFKFTKDTVLHNVFSNPKYDYYSVNEPRTIVKPIGTATKDQEFTVTDKMTKKYYDENQLYVPIKSVQTEKEYNVRWNELSQNIEMTEIPTVKVYVLRDKATGKFYSNRNVWWEYRSSENPLGEFIWDDKWNKGKIFKMKNLIHTFLMEMTGYYEGMPQAFIPEWMNDGKGIITVDQIPDTWELVEMDKLSKKELQTIEIYSKINRIWQLRPLTMNYGSAVRNLYNELEKNNIIEQYTGILTFSLDKLVVCDELTKEQTKVIDDFVKESGVKYKRVKDKTSIAFAFENKRDAVQLKLSYDGNLKFAAIDLQEMKEIIE